MFDVAIKPAQTESVKTGKQSERSDSIVLQGSFSTGDYTYKSRVFARKWLQKCLRKCFGKKSIKDLKTRFFAPFMTTANGGAEFGCERGTTEEFIVFLKLCVLTEREIEAAEEFLIVEAETDLDLAGLSECSYFTERLGELVEIACEYYKPTGFSYRYNDGCDDRMSGYSISSESVTVSRADFARVPAREKLLGRSRLKERLVQMDVSVEKIEKMTDF